MLPLFFDLTLKGASHEVFGCPWRTGCERRTYELISLMCTKNSSHKQTLSESGFKLLASLDIFRWHFQRKYWCALALASLWVLLNVLLSTWGFVIVILQKTALFQPTCSVVFSSCTSLEKCFPKTMWFLGRGIPCSRKWEEHFSKEAAGAKYWLSCGVCWFLRGGTERVS